MHPEETRAARCTDGLGQPMDRDRAGIRGEDRVWAREPVDFPPQIVLDLEVLEDGLDDDVRVGDAFQPIGRLDPVQSLGGSFRREPSLGHRTVEISLDPRPAGLGARELRLIQHHRLADRSVHLGDAVAHETGAGHEDAFDRGRHGNGW